MSYQKQLIYEIDKILERLGSQDWNIKAIRAEICLNHESELNGEAFFSRYNINTNVYEEVRRRCNKKLRHEEFDSSQLNLFGQDWEQLQRRYLIERDGEHVAVLIENMTDEELEEKAKMHDRQADEMRKHAQELREYKLMRKYTVSVPVYI